MYSTLFACTTRCRPRVSVAPRVRSQSVSSRFWKVWWRGAWLVGVSVAGYSGVAEWLPAGHGLRDVHGNPLPVLYRDDISPSQRVSSRCHWLSYICSTCQYRQHHAYTNILYVTYIRTCSIGHSKRNDTFINFYRFLYRLHMCTYSGLRKYSNAYENSLWIHYVHYIRHLNIL